MFFRMGLAWALAGTLILGVLFPAHAESGGNSRHAYGSENSASADHPCRLYGPIYVMPPIGYPHVYSYSTVIPGPVPHAFYYRQETFWSWQWGDGGSNGPGRIRAVPYTFYQWQAVPLITVFPLPGLPIGPIQRPRPSIPHQAAPRQPANAVAGLDGRVMGAAIPNHNPAGDRMREAASQFMENGDRLFHEGQYREAYAQYRSAAKASPAFAAAYFRQVFALTAIGAYDLAVQAAKRGLQLDPAWPHHALRLSTLYGGGDAAKREHFARLAEAVQNAPHNGDLLFLLGVMLYFDDRAAESQTFFAQALPLLAGADQHVRLFLERRP